MDAVRQLQRLGWEWRPDGAGTGAGPGVLFSVSVSGRTRSVFVPLSRVWVIFDQELQKVGCPSAASVGAPFSVGGFFSFVKKAASSAFGAVKSAAQRVVPKAIQRAAAKVVSTAKGAVNTLGRVVSKIPILGTITAATAALALLPATAASQLVQGKRIDQIAIGQFKSALSNAKTLAPYAQTVLSFVPGVGTGLSAGIGGALALAQGQSITQAVEEAVKSALPGGPLAKAAFSIASGVMEGKPIDAIAVNALPIGEQQKSMLLRGLGAAKALASGKRVDQVLLDEALHSLPPTLQKAVQIGTALGHAKNLQGALGAAAHGAAQLVNDHHLGTQAAQAYMNGARSPAILQAMQRAQASRFALGRIVQHAQGGHPQAAHIVNALQRFQAPRFPNFMHA